MSRRHCSLFLMLVILALSCIVPGAQRPAQAQAVVAIVNGEAITAFDIAQRTKIISVTNHRSPSRQEVLEELIEDRIKLQTAAKYNISPTDNEVNERFALIGSRSQLSPAGLSQALAAHGIQDKALKARIRADLAWMDLTRGRFRGGASQVREADIVQALEKKGAGGRGSVEMTLQPILFVIPRDQAESLAGVRMREAEALRSRLKSCEDAEQIARSLKEVVVRDKLIRTTADVSPALRQSIGKTPVGKALPPERTGQGVELYVICDKKEIMGDSPERRDVRDQIISEQLQSEASRYLRELRAKAAVDIRSR